jgi:tricorn protease
MPVWSPDGQSIAYLSDESGEYQTPHRAAVGLGEVKKSTSAPKRLYLYYPWSPDGKKLLFRDSMLTSRHLRHRVRQVKPPGCRDYYDSPLRDGDCPSWSPDSKWILYTKQLQNHLRAVTSTRWNPAKETQITDGLSDARHARFDPRTASTSTSPPPPTRASPPAGSTCQPGRVQDRSVYVVVLRARRPSPLAPESDEEKRAKPKRSR